MNLSHDQEQQQLRGDSNSSFDGELTQIRYGTKRTFAYGEEGKGVNEIGSITGSVHLGIGCGRSRRILLRITHSTKKIRVGKSTTCNSAKTKDYPSFRPYSWISASVGWRRLYLGVSVTPSMEYPGRMFTYP